VKTSVICAVLAAVVACAVSGCTARERAGYSSIPQNSPSSWETNPYEGRIRN